MTDEKIFEKIEEIYNSEKGKNFISHLLRSFFPNGKGTYASTMNGKKNKRCCITGAKLIGRDDVLKSMLEVSTEEFASYLKQTLIIDENSESVENPFKKQLKGAVLGIECKDSDKMLSPVAYQQLYNFYATKLLAGDGHMNWLARNMMAAEGIKYHESRGSGFNDREKRTIIKSVNKPGSLTLGDLGVLQDLKKKFEDNEQTDKEIN